MLSLRDLQAGFLRAIATAPASSVLAGVDPALLELVEGRGPLGAADRLGVYAEMYWARLVDVLRDDFPRVATILGSSRFTALSCAYLTRRPSTRPSVRWVGSEFANFLARDGAVEGLPFLADVARLEWTRLAAFDAADAAPLRVESLRAIPPSEWSRLTFDTVPALHVLRVAWPVHELWAAEDAQAVATALRPAATVLRVWRDGFTVYHSCMDPVEERRTRAAAGRCVLRGDVRSPGGDAFPSGGSARGCGADSALGRGRHSRGNLTRGREASRRVPGAACALASTWKSDDPAMEG